MYDQNRLTRKDIIGEVKGLWELVDDHQKRCSFDAILLFVDDLKKKKIKDADIEQKVRYKIQYDIEIRSLIQQKGQVDPEIIDFLFGRTLIDTLKSLGMKVRTLNGRLILSPTI